MDITKTSEFKANLERIKTAYPDDGLLSRKQMASFLGNGDTRILKQFDIDTKLTRESFAMRLTLGGKEWKEEKADDDKTVDTVSVL